MSKKGVTLIEMVSVIVVLGVSIPILLTMWADVAWRSSRSEVISDAIFYAQQLMEEVKSKGYDQNTSPPWTNPANLGPDGGETYPNFNDVDDFNNYSDTVNRYNRSVSVKYVYLNGNNWDDTCSFTTCQARTDCATCDQCCYKKITVTVSRTDNLVRDITLVTTVSGY